MTANRVASISVSMLVGAAIVGTVTACLATTTVGGWSNDCAPAYPPAYTGVILGALGVAVLAAVVAGLAMVLDR